MKVAKMLLIGAATVFTISCQDQPKKSASNQPAIDTVKVDVKADLKVAPNKAFLEDLDKVLSPFEDMTEFALQKDKNGILKSMDKVNEASKNKLFEKSITSNGQKLLAPELIKLQLLIDQHNYNQIAIEATEIFGLNINNFKNINAIETQIQIEHLDYMGFKTLALLNQDKIDWVSVKQTAADGQKVWLSLNSKVKNVNLTDTFDYLFKGLALGSENKDVKMTSILANMDLTLVDVLEGSF